MSPSKLRSSASGRKPKPGKQPKSYGNGGYPSGTVKPCPTCYAPMERAGSAWTCTKHGTPTRP